jgi:hypothetical protein
MNKFEIKSKKLQNVIIKIGILQIIALLLACGSGICMTIKELYWQQIFIIPGYCILLFGIIQLNEKWLNEINKPFISCIKQKRKAKLKEIGVWYKFRLQLNIWFSTMKGKTHWHILPHETWYDGYWFNTGYFAFVQFKYFAIHIKFKWWKIRL